MDDFFTVSLQFSLVSPVKINELRVPAVTRHGTAVILDCDYTFDGPTDHEGLVVKWYLNDQSRPVYVWIPDGASGPKGLGVLSGRLNLGYRVSEDAKTEHRALHIVASARDLAGEYTCVVSTFQNEDRKTKFMLVFGKFNFLVQENIEIAKMISFDFLRKCACA